MEETLFDRIIDDHINVARATNELAAQTIMAAGQTLLDALTQGNTVFTCGNGGSAADAQHFAAELVGRFDAGKRRALPGIALTVDSSTMTSVSNDFGYENIFARQIEGLARPGDILVGITTSGRSRNVLAALEKAYGLGLIGIGLAGQDPSALSPYCKHVVSIPHEKTARIQEMHITVIHTWCQMVDEKFAS